MKEPAILSRFFNFSNLWPSRFQGQVLKNYFPVWFPGQRVPEHRNLPLVMNLYNRADTQQRIDTTSKNRANSGLHCGELGLCHWVSG
jgi:hypothetical protein